MYILVNNKLTKSQRIPQASHAVAEYMFEYHDEIEDWVRNHRTMVVLQCSEERMEILSSNLKSRGFRDDDLDNMLTAVAFEPMTKEEGSKHFHCLRLA
jgi:hypothetical protein